MARVRITIEYDLDLSPGEVAKPEAEAEYWKAGMVEWADLVGAGADPTIKAEEV